jgi:DNA-binding MarR family transcriptional regulator
VIGQLVRRVRAAEDRLPLGQAAALGYLDRDGPMTASDLAVATQVRQQSMARTISELVRLDFVDQKPHASDRRKTLIVITAAGRAALKEERDRRAGWLAQAIDATLNGTEQAALGRSVDLLRRLVVSEHSPDSARLPPVRRRRATKRT